IAGLFWLPTDAPNALSRPFRGPSRRARRGDVLPSSSRRCARGIGGRSGLRHACAASAAQAVRSEDPGFHRRPMRASRQCLEAGADGAEEMTDKKDSTAESMRAFGTLGSVGLSFVIAIVLGVGGGLLIDRWIGSSPAGFFIGFALGVAAGIVNV